MTLLSTHDDRDTSDHMRAVDIATDRSAPVINADASSIMAVIGRAAADPNTDVDKLERLLGMFERIQARDAERVYNDALAILQPLLPEIEQNGAIKNSAGKVQSTYAKWEDINDAIKPLLSEHGFSLSFKHQTGGGQVSTTGILRHRAGHKEETTFDLPADGSGSKNAVQAVGSAFSYGKRYAATALLNITSRGEDDGGQKAGDPPGLTAAQVKEIDDLIGLVAADRRKFLSFFGAEKIADIPTRRFGEALRMLNAKRERA